LTVTLSNGGGTFQDSVNVYTAGVGIDITDNVISRIGCDLSIGDIYAGGIIFYLDASGCHGLVCATTDQSTSIYWYNLSYTNTTAFASSVGGGDGNTSMIVYNQGTGSYAAKLCYDLSLNGYSDWYLPSKYELNLMYLQKASIGGFATDYYWSSTEYSNSNAWILRLSNGAQSDANKFNSKGVRAVRAF